jgi:RecG-like helicase
LLAELGLYTLDDMLYYYPRRYENSSQKIMPIYSITEGIAQKWFRNLMEQVVTYWAPAVADALPESIRSAVRLMSLDETILQIHFPNSHEKLQSARERLVFDEIFYLQLVLLRQNIQWNSIDTKRFDTTDVKLIGKARSEAQKLFDKDPKLSLPENLLLADTLKQLSK